MSPPSNSTIELTTLPSMPPSTHTLRDDSVHLTELWTPVASGSQLKLPASMDRKDSETTLRDDFAELSERERQQEAVALHPVDRGLHAWMFVGSAFLVECMLWGFGISYGVFQEWLLNNPPFDTASEGAINAIGTITLGTQYSVTLIGTWLLKRYPRLPRWMIVASLITCTVALFLSSFATKVWQLILLQGVLYGLGGGFLYCPVIFWLSDWFVERRALAGGIVFGGFGVGGAVFPFVINALLERVGFHWTMRIWTLLFAVTVGLSLTGIKGRVPMAPPPPSVPKQEEKKTADEGRPNGGQAYRTVSDWTFMKSPLFATVAIAVFVQGLAYACVSLYIPSYANSLGFSRLEGTIALALFNLASVVGQVLFGYYCDKKPYTQIMVFSGVVSTVLAFGLWGYAHKLVSLYWFAILFAAIAGGFSSTWMPVSSEFAPMSPHLPFGVIAIFKGVSTVVGPTVAAALHPRNDRGGLSSSSVLVPGAHGWAGFGFTDITIFVGSMMAATTCLGILSVVLRHFLVVANTHAENEDDGKKPEARLATPAAPLPRSVAPTRESTIGVAS